MLGRRQLGSRLAALGSSSSSSLGPLAGGGRGLTGLVVPCAPSGVLLCSQSHTSAHTTFGLAGDAWVGRNRLLSVASAAAGAADARGSSSTSSSPQQQRKHKQKAGPPSPDSSTPGASGSASASASAAKPAQPAQSASASGVAAAAPVRPATSPRYSPLHLNIEEFCVKLVPTEGEKRQRHEIIDA